ncbi:hypothetical protein RvY_12685 [Ramazzottius varieornatus]|uniref:RRM domain-containing protein n=1 Tax=Ramazzottius varieornatus TaxID=947166 RepID=A0A1D1VSZ3_RAMVA|nr:hypothetical protein RvY_12685 [Ramazzottius varieornatus]
MAYANGSSNGIKMENGSSGDQITEDPIDKRKAFVGGLTPDTTEEDLKTYFGTYGEVQHAVVKRDPASGRSRCFAFVTFAYADGLTKCCQQSTHTLKGKKIDPKPAEPRPGDEQVTKIFVGGIDTSMEEEELKAHFEKHGRVKNIEWPKDRLRDGAKKNFAFVEFEDAKVVEELVKIPKQQVGSRQCDIRKAVPAQQKQPHQYHAQADPYGSAYGGYSSYGAGAYGGGYGAAAAYDPTYASYYASQGYDQSAYAGYAAADPNAAATAAYAGYPGYDQYGNYDYSQAGYGAADPNAAYGASAGYAARGAVRPRGGGPMTRGATRPGGFAGAGARGASRGYHPYRRA